jgi:hypothetical protein
VGDCSPPTPNHPSDGELIRGEAATIASPQVPPVDVAATDWRNCDPRGSADDRRANGRANRDLTAEELQELIKK